MCGVAYATGENAKARVAKMLFAMRHRGTVKPQTHEGRGWALGHLRLPIVGLSDLWNQPIQCSSDVFAWVGELYDFREGDISPECDTAIVTQYAELGELWRLYQHDGMYAVVTVSTVTGTALLIQDPLGKKPLYVHEDGGVASEIGAFTAPDWSLTPDFRFKSAVEKWGYDPTGRTQYREIRRLDPAFEWEMNRWGQLCRRMRKHTWYGPAYPSANASEALVKAVRRRVHSSDVPVAILVSGGIDSSVVAALARGFAQDVSFVHIWASDEELNRVQLLAEYLKTGITVIAPEELDERDVWATADGPVDMGSVRPQIQLARALQGKFHVVLGGDGADEVLWGYARATQYNSQQSDVHDELVHYHCPRLDSIMMHSTIEMRSPFMSVPFVDAASRLRWLPNKEWLRAFACELNLPPLLINAPKIPLRIQAAQKDRMEWSRMQSTLFFQQFTEVS